MTSRVSVIRKTPHHLRKRHRWRQVVATLPTGLFADGLLLDLRPVRHPPWELREGCLRPRLDHATVARLRGLADPAVAAAVTLSRATAMMPRQLLLDGAQDSDDPGVVAALGMPMGLAAVPAGGWLRGRRHLADDDAVADPRRWCCGYGTGGCAPAR